MASTKVAAQEIITALLEVQGRMNLAAERLGITKEELITGLCSDSLSTFDQLRMNVVVNMYGAMLKTQAVFLSNLADLRAPDLARAYTAMLQSFATITAHPIDEPVDEPVDLNSVRGKVLERLKTYEKSAERAKADAN